MPHYFISTHCGLQECNVNIANWTINVQGQVTYHRDPIQGIVGIDNRGNVTLTAPTLITPYVTYPTINRNEPTTVGIQVGPPEFNLQVGGTSSQISGMWNDLITPIQNFISTCKSKYDQITNF
jgi:hypothetical protein